MLNPNQYERRRKRVTIFCGSENGGSNRIFNFDQDIPLDAVKAIIRLENSREDRKKVDIQLQLEGILDKVREALQHSGISDDLHPTDDEAKEIEQAIHMSPMFDITKRKKDLKKKQFFKQRMKEYMDDITTRYKLVDEVRQWFTTFLEEMSSDLVSEDEINEKEQELQNIDEQIREAFQFAAETSERLQGIGCQLMKEAGYLDSDEDDEDSGSKSKRAAKTFTGFKPIIDDAGLLQDRPSFDSVCQDVKLLIEQAVRMVRTKPEKTMMRTGVKQYKFLLKAIEFRMTELKEKENENLSLQLKVEQLTNERDSLEEQGGRKTKEMKNIRSKLTDLKRLLKEQESLNAGLQAEIAEMEIKISEQEEDIKMLQTGGSTRHIRRVSLTSRKSSRMTRRGSKDRSVHFVKEDIDKLREELSTETQRCAQLERQLKDKEEVIAKLEAKLNIIVDINESQESPSTKVKDEMQFRMKSLFDESESLERQVARLQSELNCKNEVIEFQERRLSEMRDDLGCISETDDVKIKRQVGVADQTHAPDMKHIVSKVSKEFQQEINRLKDHIEKEKQRAEAVQRKSEQAHKETLANVHKQSIHLLRAINRFKGAVVTILEREHLPSAAADVDNMEDLPIDEGLVDTKLLLRRMAGNAVELLVTIEFKLSQALMNKRLEVKDNTIARSFATKDLETQMEAAQKARQQAEGLSEKLRETKEELRCSEEALKFLRKKEDEKFENLTERYKQLWSQYSSLHKEMNVFQKDFAESFKKKDTSLKTLMEQKKALTEVNDQQQVVITKMADHIKRRKCEKEKQYSLKLSHMNANLRMLGKVYRENKISRDLYSMTVDVIRQYMEIPVLRLKYLFKRYIKRHRLQEAREHLEARMLEDLQLTRKHSEMGKLLSKVDEQLTKKSAEFMLEDKKLEQEKKELFKQMSDIFSDVTEETGILLLLPAKQTRYSVAVVTEGTGGTPMQLGKQSAVLPPVLAMPHELRGRSMSVAGDHEKLWKLPRVPAFVPKNAMNTPRLLDLDINHHRRAAQRALLRMCDRPEYDMAQVEGYDYQDSILKPLSILMERANTGYISDLDTPPQRASTPTTLLKRLSDVEL